MNKSVLLLLILFSAYTSSAQLNFEEKYFQYYSAGLNSESGADFIDHDGDGQLDVLMGWEQRSKLMQFKNVGSTFDINIVSDSVSGYCYIKRVDLNRDGFDDYLLAEKQSTTGTYSLYLYTNDGNYNYTASFVYYIGFERIERIDTADLDQDGDVDLIVDRFSNSNVFSVIENLGNGSFVRNQISFVGQPSELYGVLDMNADGFPDVVGAYYNFSVSDWILVVVETDTSLSPPYVIHNIDTLDLSREGVVANFSGSSLPDIMVSPTVASGAGNTDAFYYENLGGFSFSPPTHPEVHGGAKLYLPNDYDGDGDMDLLAHNFATMLLVENLGTGSFDTSTIAKNTSIPKAWQDVNADGLNDLLCSFRGTGSILTQMANGTYETFWRNDLIADQNILLFDTDQNGKVDIFGSSYKTISTSNQTANGYFLNTEEYEPVGLAGTSGNRFEDVLHFDKDNDGDQDVLVGKQGGLYWLDNTNGVFTGSAVTPTLSSPRFFREGDFDGDNNKDILLLSGSSLQYLEWNGTAFTTNAVGIYAKQYAVGDVDQDGDEDFLYTDYNSGSASVDVLVGSNNGSGSFTSQFVVNLGSMVDYSSTNNESSMLSGDYDSDGDMDFFLLSYAQGKVILLRNDSNNVITPSVFSSSISSPNNLKVVDLDQDGDNDVIITSFTVGDVMFYENDGNQNFSPSSLTDEGFNITGIEVLDFEGDGDLDVFVATPFYLLLKNTAINCTPVFSSDSDSLCPGDSLMISGRYYQAPAMAYDSLTAASGCDSLHLMELFLYPTINLSLTQDSTTLFATAGLLNYQWFKNDTLLNGETLDSIQTQPYGSGTYYASTTTLNGCVVFSDTIVVLVSGIGLVETRKWEITLFPNPTSDILSFESQEHIQKIEVFDFTGRRVLSRSQPQDFIDLSSFNSGVFLVRVHFDGGTVVRRVVRE